MLRPRFRLVGHCRKIFCPARHRARPHHRHQDVLHQRMSSASWKVEHGPCVQCFVFQGHVAPFSVESREMVPVLHALGNLVQYTNPNSIARTRLGNVGAQFPETL